MRPIEKNKDQIIFGSEIDESLANAIRRYINHIPILAIDELEISRNDSPLYDETVAHRVGLIPLKMDKNAEKKKIKLDVKKEGIVYSGDLKGGVDVIYKKIPITTLGKGQELEFTAGLRLGTGTEHGKFSPGLMFYRNASEISIDKDSLEEIKQSFPNAEIKEKAGKITIKDDGKKDMTDVVEGVAHKNKKKVETTVGKELIITLESFGQLDVKEMFANSVDALKKDLSSVAKEIGKA